MMIYLQVAQSELLFVITGNYFCTEEAFRKIIIHRRLIILDLYTT